MPDDPAANAIPVPAAPGTPGVGDETEPNASQTAENTCPRCGGAGAVDGQPCPECAGTGLVTVTVGDA